jgi:hypothetical protein
MNYRVLHFKKIIYKIRIYNLTEDEEVKLENKILDIEKKNLTEEILKRTRKLNRKF